MRINAISAGYENRNKASDPNFNGMWMRFGRYRTGLYGEIKYAWAGFVPCKDGVQIANTVDPVKGRNIMNLAPCDLTMADCENAVGALFKGRENDAGYQSLLKLRTFIKSIMTKDGHHNALFIEDKDVGDVNKLKHKIKFDAVEQAIKKIGNKLGYVQESNTVKPAKFSEEATLEFPTDPAELAKYLAENGIA